MKKINIAINGFGRIGRGVFRIISQSYPQVNIVAINDLAPLANLAYLLKHDTAYGAFPGSVKEGFGGIVVKGKKIPVYSEKNPADLPWAKHKVDVVLECTGVFRDKEGLSLHLKAGAKKVVLSAPAKSSEVKMIVLGVNEKKLKASDHLVSCASCTTNCLAPATELLRKKFGIKKAVMSTVHAYTAGQNIVDGPNKDLRRGRAGALNIVPTTTGAAEATTAIIPELGQRFTGISLRVPVITGSLCDSVYLLKKKTDFATIANAFSQAAKTSLKGILAVSDDGLVSSDIIGSPYSTVIDLASSRLIDGDLLKLVSWYDNEWGYSCRLIELAINVSQFIK